MRIYIRQSKCDGSETLVQTNGLNKVQVDIGKFPKDNKDAKGEGI